MSTVRERLKTRWGYLLMYVFLSLAGILSLLYPPASVDAALPSWAFYVWNMFFLVGGTPALWGTLMGKAYGEALLPLPASSLSVYGLVLIATFVDDKTRGAALLVGLLFVSFACGLIGRWFEAMRILRISRGLR